MRFEYILLIILFTLPVMYKLSLWASIFESQNYDFKKFYTYLKTRQGREQIFHFWILLELPIFIVSFIPFFSAPLEILLFSIMFYFAILYNIFVVWKILRKKIIIPKYHFILFLVFLLIFIDGVFWILLYEKYVYTYVSWLLLFMPVYFIAAIWTKNICSTYLKVFNFWNKNIWKK